MSVEAVGVLLGIVIIFSILFYIYQKLSIGRCYCNTYLGGKTVLITGGNRGIGYETALELASRGCRLIIADKDNAEASKEKIIAETNNQNVIAKHLDLASFSSIRKFAKEIIETEPRLDILINNAGIGASPVVKTEDGLNILMQINYYGPFLLTYLLIDLIKKSAPSRIIFTSSCVAFFHTYVKNDGPTQFLYKENNDIGGLNYSNSKLFNIIAAKKFGEKLKGMGVTSNSLYPGAVKTQIFNTAEKLVGLSLEILIIRFMKYYVSIFGKSLKEGIQTTVHLALSKELENVSGKYFWDCKPFYQPSLAKDKEFCDRVWKFSEKMVGIKDEQML